MNEHTVTCGFLPLIDAAPLIIARELLFAQDEGINLQLIKQPSWSALRDLLALGQIDVAHMLSPMPIAMTLGQSGMPTNVDALMVLSVNGTVIGVSNDLARDMEKTGWSSDFESPAAAATALFASGRKTIRIGIPFPFSMHRMLLEHWLSVHPSFRSKRVEIITVPPPRMAQAVSNGTLDMFCVGEPWGTAAVQQGVASLILPGSSIWQFAPEKVLGATRDWIEQNPTLCNGLMRAIYRATQWLDDPGNKPLAVEILARSQHIDLPHEAIDPAISAQIVPCLGAKPVSPPHFLFFNNNAANFPWRSQAAWISERIAAWCGLDQDEATRRGKACFRSDLYRGNLSALGVDMPGASAKVEGALKNPLAVKSTKGQLILGPDAFFDGAIFDFDAED
ncbi:CmpA/NrtA family ABC transporter substrate-binding protein [Loktanella sp. S4079]|uniref:CmpA/NrtA family ABC transporter substrate-binding protein n=1 Tax=Loktanella sp. S4079 TaxID=579483 RepID=UPI0005F9FA6D|nr:CmpA/NrtA family ABC transporter substrate-binding protein [Loktanella sp. S4079]KJZ19663.1 nitrate transporter [Loktanella sp. S4079]